MFHVFHDCLLPDSLFDTTLRLDIERVRVECRNLALAGKLGILCAVSMLSQEFSEARRVGLCGRGYFRLCLNGRERGLVKNVRTREVTVAHFL
jgi:hypothetical protein